MFGERFKRTYALSDQGVANAKRGTFWTVVVNLAMMMAIGFLYFLTMGFMATLTDGADLPPALPYLVGIAAFLIASFVLHLMQYQNTYSVVYGEVSNVRVSLAERLRKLPLGFFGRRDLADLTETIMSDVQRLEHVWSHVLGYLYGAYISTAIVAVVLFVADWRLALSCLWSVPVAFALLFWSRRGTGKLAKQSKEAALRVSDGVQETLDNLREIRATSQEQLFLDRLNAAVDEAERAMVRGELFAGIFVNAASVIMRLGIASTVLAGVGLMLSGRLDFMMLFMFLLVITRIYAPFDQALALIAEVFISGVSVDRINGLFGQPIQEGEERFEPHGYDVAFKDVGFAYHGERVLDGVSFTAKEGEVTALVGPSGSGKSTCARLAARLWDVQSGTVEVGGVDVKGVDPETLMGAYSMVFQDVVLFDDTVMENIRLGKHGASDDEVRAAATAANCDEFVERMSRGYQTPIGENGARLSGGERQRISIARALLKDAPIVLLDEATASLDVENETKVQGALSRLLSGKTVLVIAHRMRTVESADKIVVLSGGKVAEQGSPDELLSRKDGIFRRMVDLQRESANWAI